MIAHFYRKLHGITNPFGAPVYHAETVSSTMETARVLAGQGEAHGTVITADFQESGRGRLKRPWATERGTSLLFTILLRYGDLAAIPRALTLKTGLAVSLAVEDLAPGVSGLVLVKWPNDVMLRFDSGTRKIAGILTEGDGKTVYIGVGVNVAQRDFPEEYRSKAGSIIQAGAELPENARFTLLQGILARLYAEINGAVPWRERLTQRLYKRGERVTFVPGAADSTHLVEGTLSGLGPDGELLIVPRGEAERAFITGELRIY